MSAPVAVAAIYADGTTASAKVASFKRAAEILREWKEEKASAVGVRCGLRLALVTNGSTSFEFTIHGGRFGSSFQQLYSADGNDATL